MSATFQSKMRLQMKLDGRSAKKEDKFNLAANEIERINCGIQAAMQFVSDASAVYTRLTGLCGENLLSFGLAMDAVAIQRLGHWKQIGLKETLFDGLPTCQEIEQLALKKIAAGEYTDPAYPAKGFFAETIINVIKKITARYNPFEAENDIQVSSDLDEEQFINNVAMLLYQNRHL